MSTAISPWQGSGKALFVFLRLPIYGAAGFSPIELVGISDEGFMVFPAVRTEKEKMLAGELYNPLDEGLCRERQRCRELCKRLNDSHEDQQEERNRILARLFGVETDAWVQPPFFCDYGTNIRLGSKVFFNFNCVVLDVMRVTIGSNVLFGPSVQIYTATHPVDAETRRKWLEFAKPVTIGSDVWIGGGAIVCPGASIGDRAVVGAGSVVTRDVPAGVLAAGNPCEVIRNLP